MGGERVLGGAGLHAAHPLPILGSTPLLAGLLLLGVLGTLKNMDSHFCTLILRASFLKNDWQVHFHVPLSKLNYSKP